jgi:hypothetical protein
MPKAPRETNDFDWLKHCVPRDDRSTRYDSAEGIAMADGDATISLGINARLLANEAMR